MTSTLDAALAAIRAELRADRARDHLSYRQQAALLGVPFTTLHAFERGRLGPAINAGFKAAVARRLPQLTGHLAQLSLAWMDAPAPVGAGEEGEPQRQPAGR